MTHNTTQNNYSVLTHKPIVHILYPSSWDVYRWMEDHKKGLVPDKYPYGFDRLEHYGFKVTYACFPRSKIMKKIGNLFKRIFTYTFNPYYFIFQLKHFLQADVFISPLDHEGLMLCWLRKHKILNLHKKKHLFTSAWLPSWVQKSSKRRLKILKSLISTVDVLMYFGECDRQIYKERLLISEEILEKIHFGVDADFFKPYQTKSSSFFFAPGIDIFRDFETLAEVALALPQENIFFSSRKIILKTSPPNIHFPKINNHKEILDYYLNAKAIIIPLKKGCPTASGSSVLREALLLNKRIIVSSTDLMKELTSRFEDRVTLVKPECKESLQKAILNLQLEKPLPELTPEQNMSLSSEYYMEKFAQIISKPIST